MGDHLIIDLSKPPFLPKTLICPEAPNWLIGYAAYNCASVMWYNTDFCSDVRMVI